MSEGDTFLPPPPFNHLYVVISNPSLDGRVVMVSFTTHTPNEEQLCIIESGEHPFVNRKTAVRYKDARSATTAQLEAVVKIGQLKPHSPVSAELLARMRVGAASSDFLPEGCRKILTEQGVI